MGASGPLRLTSSQEELLPYHTAAREEQEILRRPSVFRFFDRSPVWTLQMHAVENANAAQHSDI
eukprot:1266086-Pleurochrysis_carterae.AAC.1